MNILFAWLGLMAAVTLPVSAETYLFDVPTSNQAINDNDSNGSIYTVTIPNQGSDLITNVVVSLNIVQSGWAMFNGDYYAFLYHNGKRAILLNRPGRPENFGSGYSDNGLNISLDDHATNGDIHVYEQVFTPEYPTPLTGVWQPDARDSDPKTSLDTDPRTKWLNQFIGTTAEGTWSLLVADVSSDGTGKLVQWGLTIETGPLPEYTLATTVSGAGSITVEPETNHLAGSPIELKATPSTGYVFDRWEGGLNDTNNPGYLAIQSNLTINARFVPAPITLADQSANEAARFELPLTTNAVATLTYRLLDAPEGVALDSDSGLLSWTPAEAQGPSTNLIQFVVQDKTTPALATTNQFYCIVQEINTPPILAAISNWTVNAETQMVVTPAASDEDIPTNRLAFELLTPLPSAAFDPNTGALTWTPAAPITNTTYTVSIAVRDDGIPSLSATQTFDILVLAKPTLTTTVTGGGTLVITPEQTNYLSGTSIGIQAVPAVGYVFNRWEGNLQGTNNPAQITILSNFTVNAQFVPAPIAITEQSINEQAPFALQLVTNSAASLGYQLLDGPVGLTLGVSSGLFTWTPSEAQGPATNPVRFVVYDKANPDLATTNEFRLLVQEVNVPPTLALISNLTVNAEEPLVVTPVAADADIPANYLKFELLTPLAGATFDTNTGVLAWIPANPSTNTPYTVSIAVRDDGVPSMSATQTFTIEVIAQTVTPPVLSLVRTNGVRTLWVNATPGHDYVLEATTNWLSWTEALQTNATVTNWWWYADTNSAPRLFYRVRTRR
jgi:subtilisin-like proprotein convertase family protein